MRLTLFAILGLACLTGCELKIGNFGFGQTSLFKNRLVPKQVDSVLPGALRILYGGEVGTSTVTFGLNVCSQAFTIEAVTPGASPKPAMVRKDTIIDLGLAGPNGRLYSDSGCTQQLSVSNPEVT